MIDPVCGMTVEQARRKPPGSTKGRRATSARSGAWSDSARSQIRSPLGGSKRPRNMNACRSELTHESEVNICTDTAMSKKALQDRLARIGGRSGDSSEWWKTTRIASTSSAQVSSVVAALKAVHGAARRPRTALRIGEHRKRKRRRKVEELMAAVGRFAGSDRRRATTHELARDPPRHRGMTCASCVDRIEKALCRIDTVTRRQREPRDAVGDHRTTSQDPDPFLDAVRSAGFARVRTRALPHEEEQGVPDPTGVSVVVFTVPVIMLMLAVPKGCGYAARV